ncbi:MAG TPA: integrase [Hyphomonas sp.]|jgi:integrase|uniref:tyrosine-type recombinase/integrase n=1 Tax=uncultured Hyphomonas sp. TaxID=225298 RepID=UPI000C5E9CC5|nr:integrase [Hyphomonas sp.]MAN91728.1 integrase [Hyphomonadaceae bacterium]HBL93063.1 integrase [Hyphomonas sp.]HCJ18894.1 integrase [Hyphomonas sp.]|tara:strand:+ start:2857 stop:4074 length:1218 start_codon:yes stop_codon:yes gene_type:complete
MKLTQIVVDGLPKTGDRYLRWCSQLPGFGVRVNRDGSKTFVVKYRVAGKQTKRSIGKVGSVRAEEARRRAIKAIAAASDGVNVLNERRAKAQEPDIAALAKKFTTDYIPYHVRSSTAADYKRSIEKFIIPGLGSIKVSELKRDRVAAFHQSFAKTPYQANRILGTLSVMLTQAEIWGMREEGLNPCLRVKRFKEKKRERYLTPEELGRIARALQLEAATAPITASAFWLLIFTGCRLGEIQKLKWADIRVDKNEIRFSSEDTKTGATIGMKTVHLNAPAIRVLNAIPRVSDNPYVIAGRRPGQYLTDFQKPWRRIRKSANLEDVRIHDLRHTYASFAASQNHSLHIVGKLLGHTQAQTTARYAHLSADPVKKANNDVGAELAALMGFDASISQDTTEYAVTDLHK